MDDITASTLPLLAAQEKRIKEQQAEIQRLQGVIERKNERIRVLMGKIDNYMSPI